MAEGRGIMFSSCSSVRPSVCALCTQNIVSKIILKSTRRTFTKLTVLQHWCILGHRWTLHGLGSKGQRSRSRSHWNKICWKRQFEGGGVQYPTVVVCNSAVVLIVFQTLRSFTACCLIKIHYGFNYSQLSVFCWMITGHCGKHSIVWRARSVVSNKMLG